MVKTANPTSCEGVPGQLEEGVFTVKNEKAFFGTNYTLGQKVVPLSASAMEAYPDSREALSKQG